ncbi:MAG: hypothetical protein BGO30_08375 [Bacteroidetes bacterium 41-46]|nr:MAG: hypothetical protein BGO30_08375 [Bacteroidetes bacterium 41-46]
MELNSELDRLLAKGEVEKTAISLFNEQFGQDVSSRFNKVEEEFGETRQALQVVLAQDPDDKDKVETNISHLKDEISDLYATVTHFASLFGLSHYQLLEMAIDKVKRRQSDPNYKRYKMKLFAINETEWVAAYTKEEAIEHEALEPAEVKSIVEIPESEWDSEVEVFKIDELEEVEEPETMWVTIRQLMQSAIESDKPMKIMTEDI